MSVASVNAKTNAVLSDDEVATYQRDGVLVPKFRLSPGDLSRLQALTRDLDEQNPQLLKKPFVSPHIRHEGIQSDSGEWMRFAKHPQILDMVEQLIGQDIILFGAVMFYKKPEMTPVTAFHQDGPSFPIKPLSAHIVWVAVYDSVIENGCLQVIPGTQNDTYESSQDLGKGTFAEGAACVDETSFAPGKIKDIELQAGQMVVFNSMIVHGARANQGSKPRAGYALRYMPATSLYDYSWAETESARFAPSAARRPIFMARGTDHADNEFARGIKA